MTWVSETFLKKVNQQKHWPIIIGIVVSGFLLVAMTAVLIWFLVTVYCIPEGFYKSRVKVYLTIAIIVIVLALAVAVSLTFLAIHNPKVRNLGQKGDTPVQTATRPIRFGHWMPDEQKLVENILKEMEEENLSLDVFAGDIRQEMEQNLKQAKENVEKITRLIRDVVKILIFIPVAFLLALFLKAIVTENLVRQWMNYLTADTIQWIIQHKNLLVSLLVAFAYALLITAALVVTLCQLAICFIKYAFHETRLEQGLLVLREVELYKKMQTHENRTDQACRASQTTTVSQTTPGP